MKKSHWAGARLLASMLIAPSAWAASATITVTHTLEAARDNEVIVVPFEQIAALLPEARMYHLVVRQPNGRVIPAQITNYQHDHHGALYDDLVFHYSFARGEKRAVFRLETSTTPEAPLPPCVYARTVPERFDDMAWENDRIAHRMYGFALNTPAAGSERLRGSGIDVWAKRVTYPIVDRWYAKGHDQFHKDEENEGLDLYGVGGSRGAGGTGVWDGGRLWTSDNFVSAQVLSNGPARAAFKLTYAPWKAASIGEVTETKQFTVDCGRNFDEIVSVFDFVPAEATVGIGITEHPAAQGHPPAVLTRDPDGRWISYWEENKDGGLGIAVILFPEVQPTGFAREAPIGNNNGNHLLLVRARDGQAVRYLAGAGWTGSRQFANRAEWETQVRDMAARVQAPLTVSVGGAP